MPDVVLRGADLGLDHYQYLQLPRRQQQAVLNHAGRSHCAIVLLRRHREYQRRHPRRHCLQLSLQQSQPAGLQYNWHRHYDPTLGRYTQTDPLANVLSTNASSLRDNGSSIDDLAIVSAIASSSETKRVVDGRTKIMPFEGSGEFADGPSLYVYVNSRPTENRHGLSFWLI